MLMFGLTVTKKQELEKKFKEYQKRGKVRESKQILTLLAISKGVEAKRNSKNSANNRRSNH